MPTPCKSFVASALGAASILLVALPGGSALAGSGGVGTPSPSDPAPVSGSRAKLLASGLAAAPADAPPAVQRAIAAGNRIDGAGYCRGGGHGSIDSRCYDCSGAVSYLLGPQGADILDSPLPSYDFGKWGEPGRGGWITVYYNRGHAFVAVAGLRFDTSTPDDGEQGPGWGRSIKDGFVNGPFKTRYFAGL